MRIPLPYLQARCKQPSSKKTVILARAKETYFFCQASDSSRPKESKQSKIHTHSHSVYSYPQIQQIPPNKTTNTQTLEVHKNLKLQKLKPY